MNNGVKIIILGISDLDINEYVEDFVKTNKDLVLAKKFTTNEEEYNSGEYLMYLDLMTLSLSYKNNAFLYVTTDNSISHGITIDEYWASDISFMTIEEFNLISDYILGDNIILCWIDKSKVYDYRKLNLNEVRIFENRLEKFKYLYFLNIDPSEFTIIVNKYLSSTDEEKNILLEEYS